MVATIPLHLGSGGAFLFVMRKPVPLAVCFRHAAICGIVGAVLAPIGYGAETAPATGSTARGFVEPGPPQPDRAPLTNTSTDWVPPYVVPYITPSPNLSELLKWEEDRMVREWTEQSIEPQTIYFPPAPPVLGAPLPSLGLFGDDVVRSLAPYVADPFYAPLSTRVAEEDLGRRARAHLEAYQAEKVALLTALREQLAAVRAKDPATRQRMLEDFAELQTPAIEELEATADALRRDFFRTRFLGGGGDWNQFRAWHLTPSETESHTPEWRVRELRVLRAAVYYQEGLSPAQRRLLREVVMDQAAAARVSGGGLGLPPGDPARVVFFSPETARLPLPAGLPDDVREMFAAYTAAKDGLKRELRERLVALDAERNTTRRVRSLQDLAAEQTARLAALEELADAIRVRLVQQPGMLAPPAPPALPGALEQRVALYLRDKNELQRVAQEKLAAALAEFDRNESARSTERRPTRRATVVRAAIDAFHADSAVRIAALNAEAETIRGLLVRHTANREEAAAGKSIDVLLREFADAFKQQQLASLYADYRAAVLEPGLSPPQRRLLLAGAVADLKLPGAIRDRQVTPDETLPRP